MENKGLVHKLAKEKKKMKSTNIFAARAEQANSIKVFLLWLYFEFPDSTAHLYRRNRRALLRRKHYFNYASLSEILPYVWSDNKIKVSTSRQKVSFAYLLKNANQ